MYLVDTNVWLERLLEQQKSEEVSRFLDRTPSESLFITDFAFHSIAIALSRLRAFGAFLQFVNDAFIDGCVGFIGLVPRDTEHLVSVMNHLKLDFDDAYQYVAAEKHGLTIVSFDGDFDRTELGRKTPADVLKG
ncbi:MAG: type II toxin-antitoxin system VapC family toxin [Candidatus Coatesbacteria bacterium]|nr:type II toxin-antitoxin system VapC family toxin [Candidatus Coatesbacteria bacterium]